MKSFTIAKITALLAVFMLSYVIAGVKKNPHHAGPARKYGQAKNLLKEGDIEGAMAHSRELLVALRDAGWDAHALDPGLFWLPDQTNAEAPFDDAPSFFVDRRSLFHQVAFYNPLYIRPELEVVPGSEGIVRVQGFMIVGWKDGRVTQVPAREIRLLPNPDKPDTWFEVWPGMDDYSESLALKWPDADHPESTSSKRS